VNFLIDAQLPPALARWLREAGLGANMSKTWAREMPTMLRFGLMRWRATQSW